MHFMRLKEIDPKSVDDTYILYVRVSIVFRMIRQVIVLFLFSAFMWWSVVTFRGGADPWTWGVSWILSFFYGKLLVDSWKRDDFNTKN